MDLDAMIAEAEAALHKLEIGRAVVKVMIEGQETTFTKATVSELRGYVARLYARKASLPTRGAIGIMF